MFQKLVLLLILPCMAPAAHAVDINGLLQQKQETESRLAAQKVKAEADRKATLKAQQQAEADHAAWAQAQKEATLAAYQRYVGRFPHGFHTKEANELMMPLQKEQAAWNSARSKGINELTAFLQKYPHGPYSAEAGRLLSSQQEDRARGEAEAHRRLLNERSSSAAWEAVNKGSADAVHDYLEKFPRSAHATEARAVLESLERSRTAVALASKKPGDRFRECTDCPELVVIPSGSFLMGSLETERDEDDASHPTISDEKPQHRITLPQPFALGRTEVTVGDFTRFVQDSGYITSAERERKWNDAAEDRGCYSSLFSMPDKTEQHSWRNPGFPQTNQHPVVCVSRDDALTYIAWLSNRTRQHYRLPTEAEWEYAARSGSQGRYISGVSAEKLCLYGNVGDRTMSRKYPDFAAASCTDGYLYTAPVMSFKPNAWGLYDMMGNAEEQVSDCHLPYGPEDTAGEAQEKDSCRSFVIRGGNYVSHPFYSRVAKRDGMGTYVKWADGIGFRVARDL